MDYKTSIVKTIRDVQATAASDEVRNDWEVLINRVESCQDITMLARMYQQLREILADAVQDASKCTIPVKMKDGTVKVFANLKEVDDYANKIGF